MVEMVDETARVHQGVSHVGFSTAQRKTTDREGLIIARQDCLSSFFAPFTKLVISVVSHGSLQCLINAGKEEIVPNRRAGVGILGNSVDGQSFNELGEGV